MVQTCFSSSGNAFHIDGISFISCVLRPGNPASLKRSPENTLWAEIFLGCIIGNQHKRLCHFSRIDEDVTVMVRVHTKRLHTDIT